MNENEIKHIKRLIKEKELDYWDCNSLIVFLREVNMELNKQELYELAKHLIKEDTFPFPYIVCDLLPYVASDDNDFIQMLEFLAGKIKSGMPVRPFVDSLTCIGESNPVLAMKIVDKLLKSREPEHSSALIGGASQALPDETCALIAKLLSSRNPRHQVTAIQTMCIIYKNAETKDVQKTFKSLEKAAKSDHIKVKLEALETFLVFYNKDIQRCKKAIENLANSHTECRELLARRIGSHTSLDDKTRLHFLTICSEDSDKRVKQHVFCALAKFVEKYPDKVLEILAKHTIRYGYDVERMGYVLNVMGKTHAAVAFTTILGWLKNKRYRKLNPQISAMVKDLMAQTDRKIILKPLFQLIDSEPRFVNSGMYILREVIFDPYKKDANLEFALALCGPLAELARKQRVNPDSAIKNPDLVRRCADVINKVLNCPKPLDYDAIYRNLNAFPNIKHLFGDSWFKRQQVKGNRTHPILQRLEQEPPSKDTVDELKSSIKNAQTLCERSEYTIQLKNLVEIDKFLYNLDRNIKTIKGRGFERKYATKLKNEPQFDSTLSEIDFIVPFLNQYRVEPEPQINSNCLDAKIEIGAQTVYVEVINPDVFRPQAQLHSVRTDPDRVKGMIYSKLKNQLKPFGSADQPIILAIAIKYNIIYNVVEDYLFGDLTKAIKFDIDKGEAVGPEDLYRDETKSMHVLDPETDLISAIVCYRTHLCDDLVYRTEGKVFENRHAKIPLYRDVREVIEKTLFTTK